LKSALINWLFFLVAWTFHKTYRYRFFNVRHRRAAEGGDAHRPIAIGLWHMNSFVGTLAHTYQRFSPLCSLSPDGRMVAFLCTKMGMSPILGSSTRGGKTARDALLDGIGAGLSPAITVDGPKGPPRQAKSGIIDIAKKSQIQVLPMAAVADRAWHLKSWDRLRIPKPFARVAVIYGEPFSVPADAQDATFEACRASLNMSLDALEQEAGHALGQWAEEADSLSLRDLRQVIS
jgi:lysophospholipid acyltransferase (LPLAT)-like uncharacterized protein